MPLSANRIPRWLWLTAGFLTLALLPRETLAHSADFCLWKRLLHVAACPSCGSVRALGAFFHGDFAQAWAFNRNIVVTAPLLIGMLMQDISRWWRHNRPS